MKILLLSIFIFIGCGLNKDTTLNEVSEAYVKLALELGHYDSDLIDAYYGPSEWKENIPPKQDEFPFKILTAKVRLILSKLETIQNKTINDDEKLHRANFLEKQVSLNQTHTTLCGGVPNSARWVQF